VIREYFILCENIIQQSPLVVSYSARIVTGSPTMGHMKGIIAFADGSELTFFELVSQDQDTITVLKYRFHYQKGNQIIFRYDNAPHHQDLSTFPDHKHTPNGVKSAISVTFPYVFQMILDMFVSQD
jgi:hypothetical protein